MVTRLALDAGFASRLHHDLSGIARALVLYSPSP